jgi:hypothetical protein
MNFKEIIEVHAENKVLRNNFKVRFSSKFKAIAKW